MSASADFEIPVAQLDALESAIRADPMRLLQLPEEVRVQAAVDLIAARNTLYKRDIWRWLRETVFTIDEATQACLRWPDKPYLHELFQCIDENQMVAIPKSRRMMVSWAVAAWATHRARFFPNNAIFIQSETESKAAYVVNNRCKYIEENMEPAPFRRPFKTIKTGDGLVGRMTYRDSGSYIWGIPEGGDMIRSYTASAIILDESDFQPQGHQALTAALPAIEKGCKILLVSSSNGPGGVIAGIAKEIGFLKFAA